MEDKNRSKALELAIAGVEKEFGKGAIMRLKDGESLHEEIPVVPTGSVGLDVALGIADIRCRIVEIYGPESAANELPCPPSPASRSKAGSRLSKRSTPSESRTPRTRRKTEECASPPVTAKGLEIATCVRSTPSTVVVDSSTRCPKAEIEGTWATATGTRHVS